MKLIIVPLPVCIHWQHTVYYCVQLCEGRDEQVMNLVSLNGWMDGKIKMFDYINAKNSLHPWWPSTREISVSWYMYYLCKSWFILSHQPSQDRKIYNITWVSQCIEKRSWRKIINSLGGNRTQKSRFGLHPGLRVMVHCASLVQWGMHVACLMCFRSYTPQRRSNANTPSFVLSTTLFLLLL